MTDEDFRYPTSPDLPGTFEARQQRVATYGDAGEVEQPTWGRNPDLVRLGGSPTSIRLMKLGSWVAVGVSALAGLESASALTAVTGFLGASALGLGYLLLTRWRRSRDPETEVVEEPATAVEKRLRLINELEAHTSWPTDLASAVVLSFPVIIFWETAKAYLKTFGPASSVWWFVATLASLVPAIWFFLRALGVLRDRSALRAELADLSGDDGPNQAP